MAIRYLQYLQANTSSCCRHVVDANDHHHPDQLLFLALLFFFSSRCDLSSTRTLLNLPCHGLQKNRHVISPGSSVGRRGILSCLLHRLHPHRDYLDEWWFSFGVCVCMVLFYFVWICEVYYWKKERDTDENNVNYIQHKLLTAQLSNKLKYSINSNHIHSIAELARKNLTTDYPKNDFITVTQL